MKTIFNKQKRSVAGVLIALTALTTALTGCQEDFELDLPLAVSARELSLTKDAGSTHVLVYSNGDWTARFTRPVKWASLNKLQGYGNNEIVFTYSANYGISRKIGVVFEKGSLTDTVMFSQAGAITDASLSFSKPAVTLLKSRSQIFTPISTNLRYCIDDLEASVTYYDNDGLPNDPVTVLTRAEEGEEGGEGEGGGGNNPGFHGLSEFLYEYTSSAANNGSGFEGLSDNTWFWNYSCGIVLILSRFIPIVGQVAIAGLLAGKKYIPETSGTLKTDSVTFSAVTFAVIFIVAALSFFPVHALSTIAEHLSL